MKFKTKSSGFLQSSLIFSALFIFCYGLAGAEIYLVVPTPENNTNVSSNYVNITENDVLYGGSINYAASVNLDSENVSMIDIYLYDEEGLFFRSPSVTGSNYTSGAFNGLEDGWYSLYAEVLDNEWNSLISENRMIFVENPFYSAFIEPTLISGTITKNNDLNIKAKTNRRDANFSVYVYNDAGLYNYRTSFSGSRTIKTINFTEEDVPDGNYTLVADAILPSGETINDTRKFVVDTIAPNISGITATPSLNFSAGVINGTYSINFLPSEYNIRASLLLGNRTGILMGHSINSPYDLPLSITLPNIAAGNNNLTLILTDRAGNTNKYSFRYLKAVPTISNVSIIEELNNRQFNTGENYSGKLNFTLEEYNLTIELVVYNSSGSGILIGVYNISSPNDLPINFNLINIAEGNYTLRINIINSEGSSNSYDVAVFKAVIPVAPPPAPPIPIGGGGGGGGGGSYNPTIIINETNETSEQAVADFFAGNRSGGIGSNQTISKGFLSGITGAVIGALGKPNVRIALYIIAGLAVLYFIVISRKNVDDSKG